MSKLDEEGLKSLLDPKKLLEQLRACETKQFTNAIDLLEQCEERHRRNEKKLSRLTIAASAGGALVGQEAVKEVGEITGIIEQVVSGDVSAIGDAAEGLGFDPSQLGLQVGPNGEIVLPGGMMGAFGGVGGGGSGTGMGVNAEKAVNSNNDESDTEEEEKGEKEESEEEEEAEEEEEESEEDEEEESEEEDEEEDEEDEEEEEDKEEEEEEEQEEEEEEEEQEEEEQEEQQEQEQEQEQQQEQPEPDPPSSDQSASIPSLPDNTEETKLIDYFEEALALTEMEAFDNIIQDTPNLLEELPAILRSRTPDTSEVIVGDYETNDPTPPVVIDEIAEIVDEAGESVEVPDSPLPPLAGIGIPEPGVFGLFLVAAWFCTGWSFRRRRDQTLSLGYAPTTNLPNYKLIWLNLLLYKKFCICDIRGTMNRFTRFTVINISRQSSFIKFH